MRDLDIDMFYDKDKKEFYCMRCQFTGTEEDVLRVNEMVTRLCISALLNLISTNLYTFIPLKQPDDC